MFAPAGVIAYSGYCCRFIGHVVAVNMPVVYVLQMFLPEKHMCQTILYHRQQGLGGSIQVNRKQYPGQEQFHSGGIVCPRYTRQNGFRIYA